MVAEYTQVNRDSLCLPGTHGPGGDKHTGYHILREQGPFTASLPRFSGNARTPSTWQHRQPALANNPTEMRPQGYAIGVTGGPEGTVSPGPSPFHPGLEFFPYQPIMLRPQLTCLTVSWS